MEKVAKKRKTPIFKKALARLSNFWRIFKPVVLLQLRDKVDLSAFKQTKSRIQKIVFFLLKFVLIAGVVAGVLVIFDFISIINKSEMVDLYVVFFSLISVLLLFSNTHQLMLSLYYSDDNKLLVTFPVKSTRLFFSKMIVYFVFDFIKNLSLLIPVTVGFAIGGIILGQLNWVVLIWMWVPLLLASAIIVVVSALLSVPYMYIYRLFKAAPILELIMVTLISIGVIFGAIFLINLIPENIDLINEWPGMKLSLQNGIQTLCKYLYPFTFTVKSMFGKHDGIHIGYTLLSSCFLDCLILFGVLVALLIIVYLVVKPFYVYMMSKSFEFDKNLIDEPRPNKKKNRYITFVNKEFKVTFRDFDVSGTFILVYVLVPVGLFFMDSVFSAISTALEGDIMTYAFNILLISLPYLASNSVIATLYSKEGRAAYMKKTKPISVILPLSSKLVFNIVLSVISIIASIFVFADFADIGVLGPLLLGISVFLLQTGHIFYSATLDIMNPQNEAYATSGEQANNPNENVSTIVGFIIAFIIALVSYFLLKESHLAFDNYDVAFIKILILSFLTFASFLMLFVLKVKAYYYEK